MWWLCSLDDVKVRWILPAFLGRGEALKNTAKIHRTFRENQQRRSKEIL
ncbi:hypothetical protein [Aggregatibacter actinomycetemcomitans]|nr:hypothetical protein [Aggregatibacter actinomycetemcomitans]